MWVCSAKVESSEAERTRHAATRRAAVGALFMGVACMTLIGGGCRAVGIGAEAGATISHKDPDKGRMYELYRPTSYDRTKAWPLVVVCAGGWFDSASEQIDTWRSLADSRGFLVVAPKLKSLPGGLKPDPADWTQTLKDNEAHILAAVNHVRAGHNISDDRIFLYGWSDGAVAALFAGLRNPQQFRAVSAAQPDYEDGMLVDVQGRVDPYQPVQLRYAYNDAITGKSGRTCEAWLRAHGVDVRVEKRGSLTRKDVGLTVDFYEQVIVGEPVARIDASPEGGNPLGRRFSVHCASQVARYHWEFGDGDTSPVAQPLHVYPGAGTYRVLVTLELANRSRIERTLDVTVP